VARDPVAPSSPRGGLRWDRDAIVAAVDLSELADDLLGPHRATARSRSWPCPSPDHAQTGRTPPVTVFTARSGEERWHCHGCGNHGTAVDLVMQVTGVDVRGALDDLAHRVGVSGVQLQRTVDGRSGGTVRRSKPEGPIRPFVPRPVPSLDAYVADCAQALWTPRAAHVCRWLTDVRQLPEDVLRANRVGADLGVGRQPRPDGVPNVRCAVVLPVLVDGHACYAQLRLLGAPRSFPKYLNVCDTLARNPRLGLYEPALQLEFPIDRTEILVTEGTIDALSAAAGGYRAAAVLSASYGDATAAAALARLPGQLVVAFDPDPAGRTGSERLVRLLNAQHRRPGVLVLAGGDLNENLGTAARGGDI
jgi:Toprim-like/CHC2 zinc finger